MQKRTSWSALVRPGLRQHACERYAYSPALCFGTKLYLADYYLPRNPNHPWLRTAREGLYTRFYTRYSTLHTLYTRYSTDSDRSPDPPSARHATRHQFGRYH